MGNRPPARIMLLFKVCCREPCRAVRPPVAEPRLLVARARPEGPANKVRAPARVLQVS